MPLALWRSGQLTMENQGKKGRINKRTKKADGAPEEDGCSGGEYIYFDYIFVFTA